MNNIKNNNYIRIFDTTLRDGEQSPGFSMNLDEKLRIATQLEKLGVDIIEAGFPIASPDDFLAVETIAKTLKNPEICALARIKKEDINAAYEAVKYAKKPRIHTFIGTSPLHMEFKLKKTKKEILEMTREGVKYAKSLCERIDFSPEDALRSDPNFLVEVINVAIEEGADVINIPDTVGYAMPSEFGKLIKFLIENVNSSEKIIFATHCHNDLGLATANSLSGIKSGARQIECTMNGIGERAGNAALEEVVMSINTRKDFFNFKTGILTKEIYNTSRLLQQITGQKVQSNKAIVGKNAFAHESGIHQHGILVCKETYEIMTPESVGVGATNIILGKHSGRAALKAHLEKMGYHVSDEKLTDIFVKFKALADKKKIIEDGDIDVLVMGEKQIHKNWELVFYSTESSSNTTPKATIKLKSNNTGEIYTETKEGTGMVDAAFQCIDSICGKHGSLTHFGIDSVTDGIDAQAIVSLRIETEDSKTFSGKSGDTDIIKASIESYLHAINLATL